MRQVGGQTDTPWTGLVSAMAQRVVEKEKPG